MHLSVFGGKKYFIFGEDLFFGSSPEFGEKKSSIFSEDFFGLHLICSPEQNRGRGLSPPMLKTWQNWDKVANYTTPPMLNKDRHL